MRLHLGLLLRSPSPAELRERVEQYRETGSFVGLTEDVLSSREYRRRRPGAVADRAFLVGLYADVLGRRHDPEGLASWRKNLADGMSREAVVAAFVQSSEAVARTGTAEPEPPPTPQGGSRAPSSSAPSGGVLAIGDSVMLGSSGALYDVIGGIQVDAEVSRQFSTGVEILGSLRDSGALPGTVVVHLGTNGYVGSDSCNEMMDVLSGRRVVIVTLSVPREWEESNNAVLRECAAAHGAGLADWASIAETPGYLADDGYHMNSEGAAAYASLIAGLV